MFAVTHTLYWLILVAAPAAPQAIDDAQAVTGRAEASAPLRHSLIAEALDPQPQTTYQVRIEQRIIIRVPRQSAVRSSFSAMPQASRSAPPEPPRYERRRIGKCVVMNQVASVRVINDDQLVLFMRDQRMIEAELEKSCSAREYYQGFYMERSRDGRLCVDRDLLQARSGGKCEVERLRQLVPED
ncbi:hypothetical protein [Blastomonas sp.]|uniref:hypothetical protein n=1 Tax=Blastomonas sp. TaxID=1909299 RepID=UPI003594284A